MKVAIIEDERALRLVLAEKFENAGMHAVTLESGQQALTFLKREKPDILLLDLILPHKDGFSILQEMKADPETQNIPVFVLSNLGEDESLKRALSLGAEDYFVKVQHPINEILERVKKRLLSQSN